MAPGISITYPAAGFAESSTGCLSVMVIRPQTNPGNMFDYTANKVVFHIVSQKKVNITYLQFGMGKTALFAV